MTTRAELEAALSLDNVRAFLRAIRLGEGTADDDGYRRLVGGGRFDSFADHPRQRVRIERYNVWSTAAGAYQFLASTWDEMAHQYGLPDFSPASQDLAAVGLIARRGALDDVIAGRIEQAIAKCAAEWASLPGSPYGQRTEKLDAVLAEYRKHGGQLASTVAAAPIVESKPTFTREAAMPAPILTALFPALVQAIPGLIRIFGDGQITERNAKAAEAVFEVVKTATTSPNEQAALEAVQRSPEARAAATVALDQGNWFDTTEAGGGGIAGAREFNVAMSRSDASPLRMPALWVTLLFMVPIYAVVGAVLFTPGWSAEIRIQVVTAVLSIAGIVAAFWLGSSFGNNRAAQPNDAAHPPGAR